MLDTYTMSWSLQEQIVRTITEISLVIIQCNKLIAAWPHAQLNLLVVFGLLAGLNQPSAVNPGIRLTHYGADEWRGVLKLTHQNVLISY